MRAYRTWLGALALAGSIFLGSTRAQAQNTWYVNCASAGGNGLSWAEAFIDLQDALDAAEDGDQIWVAACSISPYIYRPDRGSGHTLGQPDEAFVLASGVSLYGGFPPGGAWEDRDPDSYETILSGDLNGDDYSGGDNSENSYHVVIGAAADATAVLDGFTITGGNARASFPRSCGGGMYIPTGGPTLNDCLFQENVAAEAGAGLYLSGGSPALTGCDFEDNSAAPAGGGLADGGGIYTTGASSPTLIQCNFVNNSATHQGGGMCNTDNSDPTLTDCNFTGNSAATDGGGMYNAEGSDPTLTGCNFTGNTAEADGGGMYNTGSSDPQLMGCTFDGNEADDGGGMYNLQSHPQLTDSCTFENNFADSDGGAMFNANGSNPTLQDCEFTANEALTNGGAIYNNASAPSLTDCEFNLNTAENGGGALYTFNASPQLSLCKFRDNQAGDALTAPSGRGGAVYNDTASPTLTRCTFDANYAAQNGGAVYNVSGSTPVLAHCVFYQNWAVKSGGGMYNLSGSDAAVRNCQFNTNRAEDLNGGAVLNSDSQPTLVNCTLSGNKANNGAGGGLFNTSSSPTLTNCILWDNTDGGTDVQTAQITTASGAPTVTYCCIQDADPDDASVFPGAGNLDDDPLFVDPDGGDNTFGTWDDDYRLKPVPTNSFPVSPCIDAGFNAAVHPTITTDLGGVLWGIKLRFINDPDTPDTGVGTGPIVDLGAHERAADCLPNGIDDVCDLACGPPGGICDVSGCGGVTDCNANDKPDDCEPWADCNGNSVQDICDISGGTSEDCNDNEVPDECDVTGGTSTDCTGNGIPDECEPDCNGNDVADSCDIDGVTSEDCNSNDIPDECDISAGTSQDCQNDGAGDGIPDECQLAGNDCTDNGIPDDCEPDCNVNGVADSCDIVGPTSEDCSGNWIPDECELAAGDCNSTGVADTCDIVFGTSQDCNDNWIPDECEPQDDCQPNGVQDICDIGLRLSPDCNGNEVPDECDVAGATSDDCDSNGVPDECQLDCQPNGTPDACDLLFGTSQDCNDNDIPDECEPQGDCQPNGVQDICDIYGGTSEDCNTNGVPDECELAAGSSTDCDGNNVPDECQPDCNGNDIADACDLDGGLSQDCNFNQIPDECDTDGGILLDTSFEVISGWPAGWQATSGATSLWRVTDQCPSEGEADGTHWAYFGLEQSCTFDTGGIVGGVLSAPTVYIPPTAASATLTYRSAYEGEAGESPDGFDSAWVDINGVVILDDVSVEDDQLDWELRQIDLSDFVGLIITLNFNFQSIDEFNNDRLGWLVDEVLLTYEGVDCNENEVPDSCDIDGPTSEDCNFNDVPDECEPDCNGNGVADACDIRDGTSTDCNFNGVPDSCDFDPLLTEAADWCYSAWYICPSVQAYTGSTAEATIDGATSCQTQNSPDVWYQYAPDSDGTMTVSLCGSSFDTVLSVHEGCPGVLANQLACNDDSCDLQSELSLEVEGGGLYLIRVAGRTADDFGDFQLLLTGPVCRSLNCNGNTELDVCDIALGTSEDCNGNEFPDTCDITKQFEEDCNDNRVPDSCEVEQEDCNDNGVPDGCDVDPTDPDGDGQVSPDCQTDGAGDGIPDECQLFENDCNENLVPDECDPDGDGDETPDDCDECPADPDKIYEGICGCGVADEPPHTDDDDDDGVQNCIDLCPNTPPDTPVDENGCPAKGACCVVIATQDICLDNQGADACAAAGGFFLGSGSFCSDDEDGDQVTDCFDDCPGSPPGAYVDEYGCELAACCLGNGLCADGFEESVCTGLGGTYLSVQGVWLCSMDDSDGDDVTDACDECPDDFAKLVPGVCGCGVPDDDTDGDNLEDCIDNCPDDANPGQGDADGDLVGDACDDCPNEPALTEPDQPGAELTCDDGIDNDCDGMTDALDDDCGGCPYYCGDTDGSGGWVDLLDFATFAVCFGETNPTGECDVTAFVCCDLDGDTIVDLTDFATFVLWYGLTSTQSPPDCMP